MYIDDLYDKSIKKMKNIAKLKKMDLHIHSPASKDYIRSKKDIDVMKEYEKFINKFIDSDLDVIAITDHNTIEGYKQIKDIINKNVELRGKLNGKYIMPGIEVACFARHFLIYFSEETKISVIEEFIKRCGIDNEKDNDKASADRVTPLTLCEIANEYNAFVCLPHADGDKGFLKDYIKNSIPFSLRSKAHIGMKALSLKRFRYIITLREYILQSTVGGVVEELPENSILISVRIIFQAQISGAIEPVR